MLTDWGSCEKKYIKASTLPYHGNKHRRTSVMDCVKDVSSVYLGLVLELHYEAKNGKIIC